VLAILMRASVRTSINIAGKTNRPRNIAILSANALATIILLIPTKWPASLNRTLAGPSPPKPSKRIDEIIVGRWVFRGRFYRAKAGHFIQDTLMARVPRQPHILARAAALQPLLPPAARQPPGPLLFLAQPPRRPPAARPGRC
jgi:hypothetical protein